MRARKNRRRVDQAAVRSAALGQASRAGRDLLAGAGFLAVCALSAWGAAEGRRYLFTAPAFAVEKLTFEGLDHADEFELARLAGIDVGDNIFQIDVFAAERVLSSHPWIRRVSIEREYPRSVVVRVIEHKPAALADLGGLYYVSDSGKAFKKLGPGEQADFPILRGISREEYATHGEEVEALFRDALEAMGQWRELGLEKRAPLSEIVVDRLEGLTAMCGAEATAVKLGTGDYREKLHRLDRLLTELSRRGARAEVIRLDNRTRPGWVTVQMQGGGQ